MFPFHCLLLVSEAWPALPTSQTPSVGRKGHPGSGAREEPSWLALSALENVTDFWPVCFFRGWETLLSNVSERSPAIIIGTWSFPSVCGMPTRNGLAEAYKHVTTQVTLFQKHATPPRATGWIIRNYSRDKREPPINPKAFPPVYKHLSYMAQKMANLANSSINDTPLRALLWLQQSCGHVTDQCSR